MTAPKLTAAEAIAEMRYCAPGFPLRAKRIQVWADAIEAELAAKDARIAQLEDYVRECERLRVENLDIHGALGIQQHRIAELESERNFQTRAGELEMWRTMHALHEATRTVGWELSEMILDDGRPKKAQRKIAK